MWGLHAGKQKTETGRRFTPTYVGTSSKRFSIRAGRPVHPHVCGDFKSAEMQDFSNYGSPPRMWGLLYSIQVQPCSSRFTPTYVGTSSILMDNVPDK